MTYKNLVKWAKSLGVNVERGRGTTIEVWKTSDIISVADSVKEAIQTVYEVSDESASA